MGEFKLEFAGIGVAKAGTTWIARCLAEHPSVCMAQGKETNFFLRKHISSNLSTRPYYYTTPHYEKGFEWYERKFAHRQPGQLCGEFSNAYIADAECASLLHAHNPEMKLLCSFRNPVDTAYAGYYQLSRVQPLPSTFEEALARHPQLLEYGRYQRNLQPFLERFPRQRFHLMLFDDISVDPAAFFRRICGFLEIDPSSAPAILNERVNPRTVLRSYWLRDLRCALSRFMGSTAATRTVRAGLVRLGAARLARSLFRLNEKPAAVPPMARDTRRRLVEFYREDNEALGDLLRRDLSHWNEGTGDESLASASSPLPLKEPSIS